MAVWISCSKRQKPSAESEYDLFRYVFEVGNCDHDTGDPLLSICIIVRKLIVVPLVYYNKSIMEGEIFPVIGAAELQKWAETYNKVFKENEETQRLIRRQAEHDAMTDALNRGSFEKLLHMYENGDTPYALILIDVDTFKTVNDMYGHAVGDEILKKVTGLLKESIPKYRSCLPDRWR